MNRKKVFIVQEVLAQFRIPLFNILIKDFDLEVLTSYPTKKKNRPIPPNNLIRFKHLLFDNFVLFKGIISYHKKLLQYCLTNYPDLLVMEPRIGFLTTISLAIKRKNKFKVIWWLSGYESSKKPIVRLFKRLVIKYILKMGDGFIVYSSEGKNFLNRLGIFQNIFIAYNSIDTNNVENAHTKVSEIYKSSGNIRAAMGMNNFFTIISTGRITKNKNYEIIFYAIQMIKQRYDVNMYYICIGDGPELETLKILAEKLGIKELIKFTGEITDEDILSKYFFAADIFVLPGIGGLAINHALAYRKPMIVSGADGTEKDQALENLNSLYFRKNDVESLVERIKYCYDNPIRLQEMSKISGELSSKQFNINFMAACFRNAVNKTLQLPN